MDLATLVNIKDICKNERDDAAIRTESTDGEGILVQLPCHTQPHCIGLQSVPAQCTTVKQLAFSMKHMNYVKFDQSEFSVKSFTRKLVSAYWHYLSNQRKMIQIFEDKENTTLYNVSKNLGNHVLHTIGLIFGLLLNTTARLIRQRMNERINHLEREVTHVTDVIFE